LATSICLLSTAFRSLSHTNSFLSLLLSICIYSRCPGNANGIYLKGGCCHHCGEKTHLALDCPMAADEKQMKFVKEKKIKSMTTTAADDGGWAVGSAGDAIPGRDIDEEKEEKRRRREEEGGGKNKKRKDVNF
jgi:hypothetical protein